MGPFNRIDFRSWSSFGFLILGVRLRILLFFAFFFCERSSSEARCYQLSQTVPQWWWGLHSIQSLHAFKARIRCLDLLECKDREGRVIVINLLSLFRGLSCLHVSTLQVTVGGRGWRDLVHHSCLLFWLNRVFHSCQKVSECFMRKCFEAIFDACMHPSLPVFTCCLCHLSHHFFCCLFLFFAVVSHTAWWG